MQQKASRFGSDWTIKDIKKLPYLSLSTYSYGVRAQELSAISCLNSGFIVQPRCDKAGWPAPFPSNGHLSSLEMPYLLRIAHNGRKTEHLGFSLSIILLKHSRASGRDLFDA